MKLNRLEKLSNLSGVSGFEEKVAEFIMEEIKGKVDESYVDNVGNVIAYKRGFREKTLMLCAHMDEVGLIVSSLKKNGTAGFSALGGVDPRVLMGKKVYVGEKGVPGVIGFKAIHNQNSSEIFMPPKMENLTIDFGFEDEKGLKEKINIGDPVVFSTEFERVDNFLIGKAFDDRSGCEVLLSLIDYLQENPVDYTVAFAFVVQEETGLRGSGIAARQIKPDAALIFENTTAGDNPELSEGRWSTRLGKGPALAFAHGGLVLDEYILDVILNTARENNIMYQFKSRTRGGTDAARISRMDEGTPCGVLSTPSRYIHSPMSMINIEDFENVIKLAKLLVKNGKLIKGKEN